MKYSIQLLLSGIFGFGFGHLIFPPVKESVSPENSPPAHDIHGSMQGADESPILLSLSSIEAAEARWRTLPPDSLIAELNRVVAGKSGLNVKLAAVERGVMILASRDPTAALAWLGRSCPSSLRPDGLVQFVGALLVEREGVDGLRKIGEFPARHEKLEALMQGSLYCLRQGAGITTISDLVGRHFTRDDFAELQRQLFLQTADEFAEATFNHALKFPESIPVETLSEAIGKHIDQRWDAVLLWLKQLTPRDLARLAPRLVQDYSSGHPAEVLQLLSLQPDSADRFREIGKVLSSPNADPDLIKDALALLPNEPARFLALNEVVESKALKDAASVKILAETLGSATMETALWSKFADSLIQQSPRALLTSDLQSLPLNVRNTAISRALDSYQVDGEWSGLEFVGEADEKSDVADILAGIARKTASPSSLRHSGLSSKLQQQILQMRNEQTSLK